MNKSANVTNKAVKKVTKQAEDAGHSILETAQTFIKDAKEHTTEAVDGGTKYLKKQSKKSLRKAEGYVKQHPRKGVAYAMGLGAVLAFIFLPRGK